MNEDSCEGGHERMPMNLHIMSHQDVILCIRKKLDATKLK